ncbi:unnamed protein product, partial [Mesorhabditis spiculigera]
MDPTTAKPESEEEDTWETLDDDALTQQLDQLKLEASAKINQKRTTTPSTSQSSWDPKNLPHVLELYDIPASQSLRDYKSKFLEAGYEVEVKKADGDNAFVVFENERRARDFSIFQKQPDIKLRTLAAASKKTQERALQLRDDLRARPSVRPKTTGSVARRLIEGSLGIKSTATAEQKAQERATIKEMKDAKKNAAAIWN